MRPPHCVARPVSPPGWAFVAQAPPFATAPLPHAAWAPLPAQRRRLPRRVTDATRPRPSKGRRRERRSGRRWRSRSTSGARGGPARAVRGPRAGPAPRGPRWPWTPRPPRRIGLWCCAARADVSFWVRVRVVVVVGGRRAGPRHVSVWAEGLASFVVFYVSLASPKTELGRTTCPGLFSRRCRPFTWEGVQGRKSSSRNANAELETQHIAQLRAQAPMFGEPSMDQRSGRMRTTPPPVEILLECAHELPLGAQPKSGGAPDGE